MKYPLFFMICLLLSGFLFGPCISEAQADLVYVTYYDPEDTLYGGPVWTGVVDTVSNKLRIDTWTELPRHSNEFWTPVMDDLPMVWDAVDSNGNPFDVPTNFGAGGIVNFGVDEKDNNGNYIENANDFAFISPIPIQDMRWHPFDPTLPSEHPFVDGSTEPGAPNRNVIGTYVGDIEFFLGWGGYAFRSPGEEKVFRTKQELNSNVEYDYRMMTLLPVNASTDEPNADMTSNVGESTGAVIYVTGRDVRNDAVITSVPEPSAVLGLTLISIVCAFKKRGHRQ